MAAQLYTLLLVPDAGAVQSLTVINGFTSQTDAEDAGDAIVADAGTGAFVTSYLVIPGPSAADQLLDIYQPRTSGGGGGGEAP